MYAMGQVESGGNYYARNPTSGAYGKYQIMPSNWPAWAQPLPRQRECQADPGQPGEGRGGQVHVPLPLARELASRRLLVADRFERGPAGWSTYATATSTRS